MFIYLWYAFLIGVCIMYVKELIKDGKENLRKAEEKEKKYGTSYSAPSYDIYKKQQTIKDAKYYEEKEMYTNLYGGKSPRDIAGVPKDIVFDNKDLPHKYVINKWNYQKEDLYTVKIAKSNGTAYHNLWCKYGSWEMNYVYAATKSHLKPCRYCHPTSDDISWYIRYKAIKEIKKKYNID